MGLRFACARAASALSTFGLKTVLRRTAGNFPGKLALYIDPQVIGDLRPKMREGSIAVVGTNGKTTVTNMLADALELAGKRVICNRSGANLDSGVATVLLQEPESDWGVFETDELWLAKIVPQLRPTYVALLDLFRDQLDRMGEIDVIQESIVKGLASSPETILLYNADDPMCQAIANRVDNRKVAFGVNEDMGLAQSGEFDAQMCQECNTVLEYAYRQYDQLGKYACPSCGFSRAELDFAATAVRIEATGTSFDVNVRAEGGTSARELHTPYTGAYMVYNMLAVSAAALLAGAQLDQVQRAIDAYNPDNGRLQRYSIDGQSVLLNLAKNPTGFNQNIQLVLQGDGPKAVGFFVNDAEGDGRDVSWLWDIDFEALASLENLHVYAGGIRRNDLQVCMKYAGLEAELVDGSDDMLGRLHDVSPHAKAFVIANYTALPIEKATLDALQKSGDSPKASQAVVGASKQEKAQVKLQQQMDKPFVIAHLFPSLLNLYGDGGNVRILKRRLEARGFAVKVLAVEVGTQVDWSTVDLVLLSGGPDRAQALASQSLLAMRDDLRAYVEDDGVLLAICGGFQMLGREWLLGEETVAGLGVIGMTTKLAEGGSRNRLVDDIVVESPLAEMPVIGYENHAGRTYLDEGVLPFGRVIGQHGIGNSEKTKADGALYRNVVGTYLHGPLLSKNPQVADALILRALERRARLDGTEAYTLMELDDSVELAAHAYMRNRLGV